MSAALDRQLAQAGVYVISNTSARTDVDFCVVHCLADTVFSVFTESGADVGGNAMTGFTIPAGTWIFNGKGITAITLASGAVRCYKR